MEHPKISQYLVSICLLIIDEFNELYGEKDQAALRTIANEEFNEMDITVKLGYPFQHTVHYTIGDSTSKIRQNHDLFVKSKDFRIEVKFLKNWKNNTGHQTQSKTWAEYQKDFDWLFKEIDDGKKDKRAFVIGWFNCVDHFSSLMQLGSENGRNPPVNEERVCYFPFLRKTKANPHTYDLVYMYSIAYEAIPIQLTGEVERTGKYECIFLGQKTDKFHFAIFC